MYHRLWSLSAKSDIGRLSRRDWGDAQQAISELYRVLGEGGMLVMCFTCKRCIEDREFARCGVALYEADEGYQMMESAGFDEIDMTRASDRHREFLCVMGRK